MKEILGHSSDRWVYGGPAWQSGFVTVLAVVALVALGCIIPGYGAEKASAKAVKADRESNTKVTQAEVHTMEEEILRLTNVERDREGLNPLQGSGALQELAVQHSKDMCRTKTLEHESKLFPRGRQKFPERLASIGLKEGGENIAYRTLTKKPEIWARQVVEGWLKSPRHKKNMLDPKFRFLGVGVLPCRNDLGYATQVFSTERGRVPNARDH